MCIQTNNVCQQVVVEFITSPSLIKFKFSLISFLKQLPTIHPLIGKKNYIYKKNQTFIKTFKD